MAAALTGGNCAISASSDAIEVVVIAILRALLADTFKLGPRTYRSGMAGISQAVTCYHRRSPVTGHQRGS